MFKIIKRIFNKSPSPHFIAFLRSRNFQAAYSHLNSLIPFSTAHRALLSEMRFVAQYQGDEFWTKKLKKKEWSYRMTFWLLLTWIMVNVQQFVIKAQEFIERRTGITIREEKKRDLTVKFQNIKGIDEYKDQLLDILHFIKNNSLYQDIGASMTKGILIVGPPGCGKTMLAKAIANEAGVNFISRSGSEFDEMYVGLGAKRVRNLFAQARKKAPCIIFIDELDCLAQHRQGKGKVFNQCLNQLLVEMDGFKPSQNIIVLAATNMQQKLDRAIKRPGRFDKILHVPLPDIRGREQLFQFYLKKINHFQEQCKPKELAERTTGFSGADIQNICNIAILNAIKNSKEAAGRVDFQHAIDRVRMGVQNTNRIMTAEQKERTAYHQSGHALVSLLTKGSLKLNKLTILPRGQALGFTSFIPVSQTSKNKLNYMAQIDIMMGGRASEEIRYGKDNVTSGCLDDLNKATASAYNYYKILGMDQKFSLMTQSVHKASDSFNYKVDKQVQKSLQESYKRVVRLLQQNWKVMEKGVVLLLSKQTVSGQEFKRLLD